MSSRNIALEAAEVELPSVPLTIEGASVLHQMMRIRWTAWRALPTATQRTVLKEVESVMGPAEESGQSAVFTLLGHKGDLLFVNFRNSLEELNAAQWALNRLEFNEFLEPTTSYVSVVELGLYESTVKLYRSFAERGVAPHSEEWNKEVEDMLARQAQAMRPRLYPKIPDARYISFYPMDRRRGEDKNWYTLPIQERQRQMEEHGAVGRRWAGKVQQIISGSIGYDDWEWGVDLFANNPVEFKKLIYEMRFDEVSGVYSSFGTFYIGVRCPVAKLASIMEAKAE